MSTCKDCRLCESVIYEEDDISIGTSYYCRRRKKKKLLYDLTPCRYFIGFSKKLKERKQCQTRITI